jgi:hypothetical protein
MEESMTSTTQPPQPPRTPAPSWREAALARSEIITDAWEVTKTYAGRIAEWVLFLCMVMNIIEILVTLPLALSNIVLGTQVVMLDVGGFSLASMGDHARERGDERAARRASVTGYFLIAVTIATLLLVTVGLLWSPAKPYTDMAEKGLILVRVVMTVIYAHVIHSLRRSTLAVELVKATDIQARLDAYSEQLRLMQAEMQQHVREVQGSVSPLVQSVVQAQTHALMSELQGVQSHLDNAVQSQFQEVYTLVQSLSLHTPEQAQEDDAASEQEGSRQVKRGTKRIVNPSITLVHSVTTEQASVQGNEQDSEPLEQRIKQYILEQRRQGSEPSLAEIMDRCSCSKGSAIRYRRELHQSTVVGERRAVGQ